MTTPSAVRPLDGVRVLDLGQYVAGPMAATLLADAGAQVTRIERPGGPHFTDPGNAYLLRGRVATHELDLKTAAGLARALELVAASDVMIENFRPGVMARLGLDAATCHAVNPGLVYCSLPGFSEDDERAGVAAWEGVVMSAGGGYATHTGGSILDTPNFPSLPLASCFAAGLAALAASAALIARDRDGGLGQRIEIPLSDALLEASGILTTRAEGVPPMRGGVFAPGLYRSRDDQVLCFTTAVYSHLVTLVELSGFAHLVDDGSLDWSRLRTDPDAPAAWRAQLVELFATRDADEWEALLRPAGVPVARLRTTREWLREPAMAAAGCVVEQDLADGRRVRTLAEAVDFQPATTLDSPPAYTGPAGSPPLAGVRVVDLCRVVAAPTVGRLLTDLGAEVIKVDKDPAQARAAYDEPLFHVYLNRGKKGAVLDLKVPADRERFNSLIGTADVFVTNVSAGRLPGIGLAEGDIRTLNPGIVFTYLNLYGVRGPWADFKGYAEIANCATGVSSLTAGWATAPSGAPPTNAPPWPYTDSMAGVISAFGAVAALYDRGRRGHAYRVNTSLAQTALLEQMPYAVDSVSAGDSDGEAEIDPFRGRDIAKPTYRIYPASDEAVFVAIDAEDRLEAFERIGVAAEDQLEKRISALSAAECVQALTFGSSAAISVAVPSATMAPDGPWAKRGLRLERPSADFGAVVTQGVVVRFARTPASAGDTPRRFGADEPVWSD